jgi:hypothetical protein
LALHEWPGGTRAFVDFAVVVSSGLEIRGRHFTNIVRKLENTMTLELHCNDKMVYYVL